MEESADVPEYIFPIFFTSKTQEIFSCKADEDVTEELPHKLITKEQIQQDFRDRAAISDFHPAKKIVEVPFFLYAHMQDLNFQKNSLTNLYGDQFKTDFLF